MSATHPPQAPAIRAVARPGIGLAPPGRNRIAQDRGLTTRPRSPETLSSSNAVSRHGRAQPAQADGSDKRFVVQILSSRERALAAAPTSHLSELVDAEVHGQINQLLAAIQAANRPSRRTLLVVVDRDIVPADRFLDLLSYLHSTRLVAAPVLYVGGNQGTLVVRLGSGELEIKPIPGDQDQATASTLRRCWREAQATVA